MDIFCVYCSVSIGFVALEIIEQVGYSTFQNFYTQQSPWSPDHTQNVVYLFFSMIHAYFPFINMEYAVFIFYHEVLHSPALYFTAISEVVHLYRGKKIPLPSVLKAKDYMYVYVI